MRSLNIRERGLAGWIDAVDNQKRIVTVTLFGGVDPNLFNDLGVIDDRPLGWPVKHEPPSTFSAKATMAVARENLMTYDPVNDRKGGPVTELKQIPVQPGSGGVQVKVHCSVLLEGYRPKRIVRVFPSSWTVISLPKEGELFGTD